MSQPNTSTGESPVVAFLKRRWLALLILAVVVVLILANGQPVELNLLFTTIETPEWVIILVTFVLGALAGWIAKSRRASRKG